MSSRLMTAAIFEKEFGPRSARPKRKPQRKEDELLDLLIRQPIFIGFKADNNLQAHLESLNEFDKKYFSHDDSTFLRICRLGEDIYIGKLVHDSLTTDRVEDIRRNILSIMHNIASEVRLPSNLKILACSAA
jgi:hypothetical protein